MIELVKKKAMSAENKLDKLRLARIYCQLVTGDGSTTYDATEFENGISRQFDFLVRDTDFGEVGKYSNDTLHIITEAYSNGGHTRLCEKIAEMEGRKCDLLITRAAAESALDRVGNYFKQVQILSDENDCEKIVKIYKALCRRRRVMLHIHPDDIVSTVAVNLARNRNRELQVFFVNHADHLFSFGKSAADVVLQISAVGYKIDAGSRNKGYKSSFLGIPIDLNKKIKLSNSVNKFLVVGASYKMRPNSSISLPRQLFSFLQTRLDARLIIVGISFFDYWWWWIKLRFPKRVKMYPQVKYEEYLKIIECSDACIDTSPITGGTAFVEMFSKSLCPLAITGGIAGYSPLEKIRLKKLTDFVGYDEKFIYDLFEEVQHIHSIEMVAQRLFNSFKGTYTDLPASLTRNEIDLAVFWRSQKIILGRSAVRDIYNLESVGVFWKLRLVFMYFNIWEALFRTAAKYIAWLCRALFVRG